MDKKSFILGMITAFCECAAAGCKQLALSPPLSREDYTALHAEAEALIQKHGLLFYHEENLDIPREERFEWLLIAARQDTIDQYLALRRAGFSPVRSLRPFSGLLSYDESQGVPTRYDAYRAYFPMK
ncbi:MAG: hypothetical protein IKQ41_05590 [Clostridia bacterium]|nr:hypothetical protein [Clostridia bacterium]